jgi:hypothetical protein
MSPTIGEKQDADRALQDALIAYLESGETDQEALRRLQALPDGMATLERALAIKTALAPFAGTGGTVDEYLEWKREEIEGELECDRRRDAQHSLLRL